MPKSNDKSRRNFIIGLVIAVILNTLAACAFFLTLEDNPRRWLDVRSQFINWLVINAAVTAGMAVLTRQLTRGIAAGFGLTALLILSADAVFMIFNYRVPTQEAMCKAITEYYTMVKEGEAITTDTTVEAAKAYYEKVGTTYRVSYDTLVYIDNLLPVYSAMGPLQKTITGLEGQEKVGTVAREIRSKVLDLETKVIPLVNKACDTP